MSRRHDLDDYKNHLIKYIQSPVDSLARRASSPRCLIRQSEIIDNPVPPVNLDQSSTTKLEEKNTRFSYFHHAPTSHLNNLENRAESKVLAKYKSNFSLYFNSDSSKKKLRVN